MQKIYFDSAAATKIHDEVIEHMLSVMKESYGNPSSTHIFGREAKAQMELSRKKIAELVNAHPSEIIFTSCGTESNNLIIRSSVQCLGVTRIITSTLEHKCVQETVQEMKSIQNVQVDFVNLDSNGSVDYIHLEELLKGGDEKTLVTLMHANNEIGNITDINRVNELCKANGAYFHSDTVQTLGHFLIDFTSLSIDFASFSAHKIHGPKGIGFAYINKSLNFKPLITGGGQERNMRSGTENVYGVVGQAKAFEIAIKDLDNSKKYILELKKYAIEQLKKSIPNIAFNGLSADLEKSLYTVLSIRLPFNDPLIAFSLELNGIAASQGSACSSGASKVSTVIESILDKKTIETTTPLRVSFSIYNTKKEVDKLVDVLLRISEKHKNK